MLDLSIVIVNWNTRDLLKDCLSSIYKTILKLSYEIWVVDNGSSDGSVEMVEREFPQVKLIKNEENLGFAKANNQAIKESKGNYILVLNSDTIILPNALDRMVEFMNTNKNVGMIGGRILNADGSIQLTCGRAFPTIWSIFLEKTLSSQLFSGIRTIKKCLSSQWPRDRFCEVDVVNGSCMMVRRKTINKIGPLDEQYFLYWEHVEWCKRIKEAGWKIYLLPEAQIVHLGGRSVEYLDDRGIILSYQSLVKYFKRHHKKVPSLLLKYLSILEMVLRINIFSILYFMKRKERDIIKRKIKSYWKTLLWHFNLR